MWLWQQHERPQINVAPSDRNSLALNLSNGLVFTRAPPSRMEDELYMYNTHPFAGHPHPYCAHISGRWEKYLDHRAYRQRGRDTGAWGTGPPGKFWGVWNLARLCCCLMPVACLGSLPMLKEGRIKSWRSKVVVLRIVVNELAVVQQAPGNWDNITSYREREREFSFL